MLSSRYLLVFVVLLAGCPHPQPIAPVIDQPAPKPATVPAVAAPVVDDHAIIERSHRWFEAWDRMESATAIGQLSDTYGSLSDARFGDRELAKKNLEGRIARHAAVRGRTWSDEHVFASENGAVFVGFAVEKFPAEGDVPAAEDQGFHTLVWTRDHGEWKIQYWQWIRWGLDAERERWNAYFKAGRGFNQKPNQLLVDTVKGKKPGTALDVGMGQGRNAVFLATQGWKVTGIDIADEGMRIASEAAKRLGVKIETINADSDKYDFGKDKYDLVTLIYAAEDPGTVKRLIPSIKHGGLFVCEYFHADTEVAKGGAGGWATGALAKLFADGFEILRDEVVEDVADWAGQRKMKLVRFVARRK